MPELLQSLKATFQSEALGDYGHQVEHIPFRETRNYVQRVAESLPIYRARLGRVPLPIPFSAELTGSTLAPLSPKGE